MKKLFLAAAALVAAVAVFVPFTLPPRHLGLAPPTDGTVPGMVHVHTNRSDGLSGPDEIAAAAAKAGLKFLVFTDHGDGTRAPDPPSYRSGVLCLDGVEISTTGGHYIAIDMRVSPYPLGGEPRDVVEDVRRLGGFGVVAHPDSPKAQLRWTDWTLPFDGVELLNPDTSWRLLAAQSGWRAKARLFTALIDYPFRAPEVMTGLIQPTNALEPWAAIAARRRLVGFAGADAHARLGLRGGDPGDTPYALPLPGYESTFKVMSIHVRPDRQPTGSATDDASAIVRAMRSGHLYTALDGVASPPSFELTATNGFGTARQGDVLGVSGAVELHVQSNAPPPFTTIVHDGTRVLSSVRDSNDLTVHGPAAPGVFWAEIVSPAGPQPLAWIRSNPIYVRALEAAPAGSAAGGAAPATDTRRIFDGTLTGWRTEQDPRSLAATDVGTPGPAAELLYRFGLVGGLPAGQFTSLVRDLPEGFAPHDRVRFSMRAERAMRVSVQIRDTTADRWQRSVYVDVSSQERTIPLADFTPVGVTHVPAPAPAEIRAVMFVVDTTNTKPGTSGRVWIKDVALER